MSTHRARLSIVLTARAIVLALLLPPAGPALAATLTVTRFDDPNPPGACTATSCSLRAAVIAANVASGSDMIVLGSGSYILTIGGAGENVAATGDLDVTGPIVVAGAGSGATFIQASPTGASTGLDRVFDVRAGGSLTLSDVTVRYGRTPVGLAELELAGGGIRTAAGSSLTLRGSSVSNNTSRKGGGIFNEGTLTVRTSSSSYNTVDAADSGGGIYTTGPLDMTGSTVDHNAVGFHGGGLSIVNTTATLTNVTISHNTAKYGGGGMYAGGASVTLNNATIASNIADSDGNQTAPGDAFANGGGIFRFSGTVNIRNSIIADNSDGSPAGSVQHHDCSGVIASQGYNLIRLTTGCTVQGDTTTNITGQNALLGALGNNGGLTLTRPLIPGSPAIDRGSPSTPGGADPTACVASDQRGHRRPTDGNGDGTSRCDIGAYEL